MTDAAKIPEPTLIGYFVKPAVARSAWLKAAQVEEICTVSDCMATVTWDWINEWRHNAEWLFDTPSLAWSVVPELERARCRLFAYPMFPVRFCQGVPKPYSFPERMEAETMGFAPRPIDASFERLGFDLVSRTAGNEFEHSPLSCNGLAEEIPTNRCCLLDTAEEAFALAPTLDPPGKPMRGEPGPYFIVEVWRQRLDAVR
jgi:hypothetical protein